MAYIVLMCREETAHSLTHWCVDTSVYPAPIIIYYAKWQQIKYVHKMRTKTQR